MKLHTFLRNSEQYQEAARWFKQLIKQINQDLEEMNDAYVNTSDYERWYTLLSYKAYIVGMFKATLEQYKSDHAAQCAIEDGSYVIL